MCHDLLTIAVKLLYQSVFCSIDYSTSTFSRHVHQWWRLLHVFFHLQARNRSGQVGYVPEKYLQLPSSNSLLSMLQSLATLDARSHSSSNSTEPEIEVPSGSVNGDSSGEASHHRTEDTMLCPLCFLWLVFSSRFVSAVSFAKALYDYAGQTDDELSFPEGAIIRILSRETHEDDGFWEGEFNGVVGVFPAVLVEDLTSISENGDGQRHGSPQVSWCQLFKVVPANLWLFYERQTN